MSKSRTILLSLLLSIPVILFLLHHYFYHSSYLQPTGFTVDENVLYMSYAHQYLDQDHFNFFYSNPFDGDAQSTQIYFQPVNFLFVAFLKAGADPGLVFSLFGLVMAILCIYIGIKIIQHLLPGYKHQSLVALLFTWGGGLTAIAGLIGSSVLPGHSYSTWFNGIFLADPANGWWGLNWGRNLFIPLEAWYHFLFLLTVYQLLLRRWKTAAILSFFLSISHPFTGIEFLLILNGWLFIEKLLFKNKDIPYWFLVVIIAITFFHGWYYLIYLNSFPEHRQLFNQYSAGWTYSLPIALAAYVLVIAISLLSIYLNRKQGTRNFSPQQRLFLCWAVIAFLLSKHEWFIRPMQPIHFTRGYIWAGLFLFSIPGWVWLIDRMKRTAIKKWLSIAGIAIFLSDNILWTINILREKSTIEWEGHISEDTREVLDYLKQQGTNNDLLIGNATLVQYLASAYSPATAWVSHPFNTPKIEERRQVANEFLRDAVPSPQWAGQRLLIIVNKKAELELIEALKQKKLFENDTYLVFTP